MIGRMTTLAGIALLGSALLVTPMALGKGGPKCGKLCRTTIDSCKATCTQTTKKDKRTCTKGCRKNILDACKTQPTSPRTACSPSGAFLD
jgi:hypothetical protein